MSLATRVIHHIQQPDTIRAHMDQEQRLIALVNEQRNGDAEAVSA